MDCAEFKANWHAYISESVNSTLKDEMEAHAKVCPTCGSDLNEFREITATVESISNDKKLPDDLSESVARQTMKDQVPKHASVPAVVATGMNLSSGMLLPIVFGILLGYFFFSGSNSEPNMIQQLMQRELLGNRFGGRSSNSMLDFMLVNEVSGSFSSQRSFAGLPQITNIVRILFLVFFVNWVVRNKAWVHFYPDGLPSSAQAARLLCLLATVLGLTRCGFSLYIGLQTMIEGGANNLESWMMTALHFIDQLWAIGFWVTLTLVLYCVSNEFAARQLKKRTHLA